MQTWSLFEGTRPETYGPADAEWEGVDEHGKRVVVCGWSGLHFREVPDVEVKVIRVLREAARDTKRDPRESWFVWTGQEDIPLEQVRTWYRKRFSQEHGYRFLKQDLLWTHAHLRTPEQVERWSWIVAGACNQLLLASILDKRCCVRGKAKSACSHPATGPLRDAQHFVAAWYTSSASQTAWKIAWLAHRSGHRTPAPRFAVVLKPKPVPKTHRKQT